MVGLGRFDLRLLEFWMRCGVGWIRGWVVEWG